MRKFRDRDFIETIEGMIFCVVGNIHPKDRVISYLKYVPWEAEGAKKLGWKRDKNEYGRILPYYSASGVMKVKEYLEKFFPQYIYFDKYLNIEIIGVPINRIKVHYKPEKRIQEILKNPTDELEEKVASLINTIIDESKISSQNLGITGSILIKIHNPKFSDIDLIVYGKNNSYKVKQSILNLFYENTKFERLHEKEIEKYANEIVRIHPFTFNEACQLIRNRWYTGLYDGTFFSIHPVKLENEITEKHESKMYKFKGIVTIKCKVIDSSESIFLPAKYLIDEIEFLEGKRVENLREIVSYEGLYCDIAAPGDIIYVRGKLEEVHDLVNNEIYHRIQIGSFEAKGLDFIKNAKWIKN